MYLLRACLKTFVAKNPACLNDLVNFREPVNTEEKTTSFTQ